MFHSYVTFFLSSYSNGLSGTEIPGGVGTLNFACYIGYDYLFWVRILNFTVFAGFGEKVLLLFFLFFFFVFFFFCFFFFCFFLFLLLFFFFFLFIYLFILFFGVLAICSFFFLAHLSSAQDELL